MPQTRVDCMHKPHLKCCLRIFALYTSTVDLIIKMYTPTHTHHPYLNLTSTLTPPPSTHTHTHTHRHIGCADGSSPGSRSTLQVLLPTRFSLLVPAKGALPQSPCLNFTTAAAPCSEDGRGALQSSLYCYQHGQFRERRGCCTWC